MIGLITLLADSDFDSHMGDWGAGWWILMAAMMVVFWGLVIVGIVWLVRSVAPGYHRHHGDNAVEILDRRFAAGEISAKDYEQRRKLLGG